MEFRRRYRLDSSEQNPSRQAFRTVLLSLISITLTVYVIVAGFAFFFADRVLFQPPHPGYTAARLPVTLIPSGQDSIAILHLPNPVARYTILFSHGNAEDLGSVSYTLRELHAMGFAVIGFDYRGYGLSTGGPPTSAKATRDAEAVYDYAVKVLRIPAERLILYGRSVGSGPTMALASERAAAGVILESPFTSVFRVVTGVRLLPFDRFPNITHISRVRAPILIMQGLQDEVIPVAHGQRLFAAAREPKRALWVEGAGHNDFAQVAGNRYVAAIQSFAKLLDSTHGAPR